MTRTGIFVATLGAVILSVFFVPAAADQQGGIGVLGKLPGNAGGRPPDKPDDPAPEPKAETSKALDLLSGQGTLTGKKPPSDPDPSPGSGGMGALLKRLENTGGATTAEASDTPAEPASELPPAATSERLTSLIDQLDRTERMQSHVQTDAREMNASFASLD